LFNTSLNNIDFSSCEIQGIGVNIKDLKGLKVNDIQALELSKILGIIIK